MQTSATASPGRSPATLLMTTAKAVCLVGFPVIPMLIQLSKVHPRLPGPTTQDRIAQLAAAGDRWSQVHSAFWVGGFLGLAAVLVIRREVAKEAPELWVNAAAAAGVVGAVLFTGTVYMEINVVPALTRACAASPVCLGSDNAAFAEVLADQGWRVLPGLVMGGRLLMLGLAGLAVLGFVYQALRHWEVALLFFGSVWEFAAETGLHAWGNFRLSSGMPGLAAVALLGAGLSISWRLFREPGPGTVQPSGVTQEAGPPAPAEDPPTGT